MEIVVPDEFRYLYEVNDERPVIKIPADVLRQTCAPVTEIGAEEVKLIDRMTKAMQLANGIGLAAPQMGVPQRVILIAPGDTKPIALINPEIVERSDEEVSGQEGCLSIPGLYGNVMRATRVVVEANDAKGKPVAYELEGLAARVAQHEIDHLDGILFIDKVDIASLHWMHPDLDPPE